MLNIQQGSPEDEDEKKSDSLELWIYLLAIIWKLHQQLLKKKFGYIG